MSWVTIEEQEIAVPEMYHLENKVEQWNPVPNEKHDKHQFPSVLFWLNVEAGCLKAIFNVTDSFNGSYLVLST